MASPHRKHERQLWRQGRRFVAGTDEVGKGAWAGPLVAAAVILPERFPVRSIRDSKLMTPVQREAEFVRITRTATSWAVAIEPNSAVDLYGIQRVNLRALAESVERLHVPADAVLVDAFQIQVGPLPVQAIIHGDAQALPIAAASVVAKVVRDALMSDFDRQYPGYGFGQHKGYGTAEHEAALARLGLSAIHRRSFAPMNGVRPTRLSRLAVEVVR